MKWKPRLSTMLDRGDYWSDRARSRLKKITGFNTPLMIIPYLGYGTTDKLLFGGRVLEDKGFAPAASADGIWRNLVQMYKRFETDEVPGARVGARFRGVYSEATADHEGYFSFEIKPAGRVASRGWQQVQLDLIEPVAKKAPPAHAIARVMVPSAAAKFGIVSDVDDTVLSSHVRNKLKMILTVILSNEHTRKPFEGVAGFYRALHKGATGSEDNPIFYVSNTPWNLYTLLVEFLSLHKIPLGPLLLRDFGDHLLFSSDRDGHKRSNIKGILDSFPYLPFVLIGDSGERDPEIYRDVVKEYPDRIRAIYIRCIDKRPARLAAIDKLIEEVRHTGSQLVLVPDSEFAAAHAAAEGLISPAMLGSVRSDKTKDQTGANQETLSRDAGV